MIPRPLLAVSALVCAGPAFAQTLPPGNSLPPVRVFTEVEWDDDGYWDIEFVNNSNRRTSFRIDPVPGEPWSRRGR